MKNKTILLISPEGWGTNFVSKHHYANYLSKNNTVYFLNPPKSFAKNPVKGMNCEINQIKANLFSVDYLNLLPRLNNLPQGVRNATYKKQATKIQKAIGVNQFDIVWNFDPNRFADQTVWKADKRIYHTVDVHSKESPEAICCKSADLVLLSSEMLHDNLKNYTKQIHNIGHAADLDNFETVTSGKITLPGNQKIKAGLIANYNNNIDYDLIEQIALTNPTVDFIFVGPYEADNLGGNAAEIVTRILNLKELPNVFFIGAVPSEDLIIWMHTFDINMVLYREDRRDIIINPHKMMGYFYAGKITVASWFNEYNNADENFIQMIDNNIDIPLAIKKVAANLEFYNNSALLTKRRKFAEENSYSNKIEQIENLLYSAKDIKN